MQPANPAPPEDDLGVESLLKGTWATIQAHPLPLVLPLVILGLLTAGSDMDGGRRDLRLGDIADDPLVLLPFFALFGLLALALLIVVFFLHVVVSLVTTRAALATLDDGRAPDLGTAFRETQDRIMTAAGTTLLWVLLVIVGFILLIVPGILALAFLFPLYPVMVAESRGGTDAIKRTLDLTRGHRGTLVVLVLLAIVASIVTDMVLGLLPIIGDGLAGAAGGFITAFALVAGSLFYHRRARHAAAPPSPLVASTVDTPP